MPARFSSTGSPQRQQSHTPHMLCRQRPQSQHSRRDDVHRSAPGHGPDCTPNSFLPRVRGVWEKQVDGHEVHAEKAPFPARNEAPERNRLLYLGS
ncbi:hypothetical protein BU16DRAFT_96253 [Lophium mytilinum]|uniref:Uncharacterized protein n=1 Tax=Lophium mytilinum TaxID=390894 RepID=A0A6A6QKN8_9PEZI|nr:hypothetical protein BU16DRAFT_96253 [Lophium mytilinum]